MESVSDRAIWDYALEAGVAIVTKDEDFAQRKVLSGNGPVVVWVRLPNTRRRDLLASSEAALPGVVAAIGRGETLIELVR